MQVKIKTTYLLILLMSIAGSAIGQDAIEWMSWKDGIAKAKEENKKVLVSLHTVWCGWCKKMDRETYSNAVIVDYINKNYVAISFDAEQREAEEYLGESYSYTRGGRRGYHTLAAKLTNGRLSYPSTVFLDENLNVIQSIPGYQTAPVLETIITYFEKDLYKSTPWISYQRAYQPLSAAKKKNSHTRLVGNKDE